MPPPSAQRFPCAAAAFPRRSAAVVAALVLLLVGSRPVCAAVPRPAAQPLFQLSDPRLNEVSGAAVGLRSPGVLYVHNDSGDSARLFALDAGSGAVRAVYRVPGATNVDWEDIAVARDARGVASIWLADIGDNAAARTQVRLYRVDEPDVGPAGPPVRWTSRPDVWRLRYPGGARDAEGLAVANGGAAYIFDKTVFGATSVYAVPPRASRARVQLVRAVGSFDTVHTGTTGGPNPFGVFTVTGAALSNATLVARTYTDAYLWHVDHDDVQAALRRRPTVIPLPPQPQGEGVAVDGNRLILTSEQVRSTVFAVLLPAGFAGPVPPATSVGSPSAAVTSGRPLPSAARASTTAAPAGTTVAPAGTEARSSNAASTAGRDRTLTAVAAAVAGLVVLIVVVGTRRRR